MLILRRARERLRRISRTAARTPNQQLSFSTSEPACVTWLCRSRAAGRSLLRVNAWGRHAPEPYDWAVSFETRVRELLLAGEYKPLVNYEHQVGGEAELAVPTPDHYLPLLYVAGTRAISEPLTFPVEGVDGGSVSMLAVKVG